MYRRLPSIRQPQAFYDVFGVVIAGVLVVAAVLSLWHGTVVRVEMAVFIGLVFLWAAWAIYRVLEQYPGKTTLRRVKWW
ncbi:MAG: hypothetical protein ABEH60_04400 [Halonotius sp.]